MKKFTLFFFLLTATFLSSGQLPSWLPAADLVAWFPFNGNANDESGYANNGVSYGAVLTTDRFDVVNSAYLFNGTDSYISLPLETGNLSGASQFTISYWVNMSDINADGCVFNHWNSYSGPPTSTPIGFFTFIVYGKVYGAYIAGYQVGSNSTIGLNTWSNVVLVYDGTLAVQTDREKLYVDGVLQDLDFSCVACSSNIPSSIGSYADHTTIGARKNTSGGFISFFNGKIDDLGIWSRVLTNCEIRQLAASSVISINTQPSNISVMSGDTAVFSVAATGSGIHYQWQQDCGTGFTNLTNAGLYSGSQSNRLVVFPVSYSLDNCQYRCVLTSDVACSDTTVTVVLDVANIGINEGNPKPEVKVFPNPFTDKLTISLKNNGPAEVTIYDILSGKVLQQKFVNTISISAEQFSKNVYFIEVTNKSGFFWRGKIIKQ
jgi:hypothetical protein